MTMIYLGSGMTVWSGMRQERPYFYDAFDRADGLVGNDWIGATWAISGGAVVNTPTLGDELFTNPGAEGVYVAGVAPDWTALGVDGAWSEEGIIVHDGSAAQKFVGNVTAAVGTHPALTAVVEGNWYVFDGWVRNDGPGNAQLRPKNWRIGWNRQAIANSAWTRYIMLGQSASTGTDSVALAQYGTTAQTMYADDFSLKQVTFSSLFLLRRYEQDDPCVSAVVNGIFGAGGVVVSCDDSTNPQSFVVLYYAGVNALRFSKFVNGVETVLDSQTVYPVSAPFLGGLVSDEIMEIRKSGMTYQAYYCGVQLGSNRVVADAEIAGNQYVGIIGTHGITFSDFCARPNYYTIANPIGFGGYVPQTYTAGQAIVSLRFDDGDIADYDYVRGELNARGLVGTFPIVRAKLDQTSGKMTLSEALAMASDGHEIVCHSYTHSVDPTSVYEFQYESSVAAEELRRLGFTIYGFVQPGVWVAGYNLNDLSCVGTPADLHLKRKFLRYAAYIYGWDGSSPQLFVLPRPTAHRYGAQMSSMGVLGKTYTAYKALLDAAIANGEAIVWLWHSIYWDDVGAAINVQSSTNASPIEITTAAAHGLVTGDAVLIENHLLNTNANGTWGVTRVDDTRFTLDDSTGNAVGGATGTVKEYVMMPTVFFEQLLDYIEAKVALGDVLNLTVTDQLFAQPG